jgi:hypothetical protein
MSEMKEAPSVYDHLAIMLDQMGSVAWQKLGLQPDMVTGKIEPDLNQARIAIDVVGYLVGVIEPQLDDEDRRQLQTLVRDLKINFVQKQGGGS